MLVAACGGPGPSSPEPSATPDGGAIPAATAPPATAVPVDPTDDPVPPPTDPPVSEPTEPTEPTDPTDAPGTTADPEPGATDEPAPGGLAGCTGTEDNLDFFAGVAGAVDWPVYCPSLPRGWFVESGQYRLAAGGRMEITYRGPDGAGLRLQQGAFCDGASCVPPGSDVGPAAFGDLDGTLYQLDGGWAVAVPSDGAAAWILTVMGVGQDRARTFAENLIRLD